MDSGHRSNEIQDIFRIAPRISHIFDTEWPGDSSARSHAEPVNAERPLIGFCGRLDTQHKGLDFLVEGFAAYKAKGGTGELWLIGDGADRVTLEQKTAQSGVAPCALSWR